MSANRAQSAVALGGGHGLHVSLQALRRLVDDLVVDDLTAVVTVADNGGSSGRLRGEFGVLPPGEDEWGDTWAKVLQHRFAGEGEMRGHVIGNLLIVGLWELLGDPVQALEWVGRLLGATGRVLPMALTPLDIAADVRGLDSADPDGLRVVRGQVEVATTAGTIDSVWLEPEAPEACVEAVRAVREADWVVLGPGSWFTSVIPHLLVPALREALVQTDARVVVVLNLDEQAGETGGFAPEDHLAVLLQYAPDLKVHTVLADRGRVGDDPSGLERVVAGYGATLVVEDVAADDGSPRHDPAKLASAYARILAQG